MFPKDSHFQRLRVLALSGLLILAAGCAQSTHKKKEFTINGPVAPEVNSQFGWLNTDRPYSLKDFRGKIVLLDFWTLGCINCQHIIPEIEKLQEKFSKDLVVIGVHSAKFKSERETDRIRSAISKFGIDHPVVNDADYAVWKAYGVEAWPTLVLVSPDGKVAFKAEGENAYNMLNPQIEELASDYKDVINETPFVFKQQRHNVSTTALNFPSKLVADANENIWVSDYGNNRIVKIDKSGKIIETIGKGSRGFQDGDFSSVTFNGPQGLAIRNDSLWIADSKNNAIRLADLATKKVTTVAGNGTMGYYFNNNNWNEPVLPNSPWDLCIDSSYLYIADAGNHQVLRMDLRDHKVYRFAGSGYEGINDSDLKTSTFSQPSGLTKSGNDIYVADPEASAIRKIDLRKGTVKTIIGRGLFKFGDEDGDAKNVLLQHCVGLTEDRGNIYIADTYNGKVKMLNTKTNVVSTLVSGLNEPNDILIVHHELWVTDTNNDQIIKFDLVSKRKETVKIRY